MWKKEKQVREKKKQGKKGGKGGKTILDRDTEVTDLFNEERKTVRELVAPNGVNPNPLDYMCINDGGTSVYVINLYIDKLPKSGTFASTFISLLNFEDVTVSVFIEPLSTGQAVKLFDKRVLVLDSEGIAAQKQGDRNRLRKIMDKLHDAEMWARDMETGYNSLYEAAFLFTVRDTDLDSLQMKVSELHSRGREKGIELSAAYAAHPEAFLSAFPLNKVFKPSTGPVRCTTIKKHYMDLYSLATLFNHTRAEFSHENGILAGRNMHTGEPFLFDIYNPGNDGYGMIFAGKTGTGKSATIKMYATRYMSVDDYHMVSVDYEAKGNRGEYSVMAEAVGGINYQIRNNSDNILNPFDVNEELVYDEKTGTECRELRLSDKKSDALNILMTLIRGNKNLPSFEIATPMEEIIQDALNSLYEDLEIYDSMPDSLYTEGKVLANGKFTTGRIKKSMPTITDAYKKILRMQSEDSDEFHKQPYSLVLGGLKPFVKELYYCPQCLKLYSRQEFEALLQKEGSVNGQGRSRQAVCQDGHDKARIKVIRGSKAYFDGQSTLVADISCPHVNIDISQLPEKDKPAAQIVSMVYLQENYIKRNSMNPKKTHKLIFLIDEFHKLFPYPEARVFVGDAYRTARKRFVSCWTATQALKDYDGYMETEAIVKNSAAIILFKQDHIDKEYLLAKTILTPSQVEEVCAVGGDPNEKSEESNIHKGEMCVICNDKVNFIKVDYLTASEARVVETDMGRIKEMEESRWKAGA